ncbi:hypothetical protein CALCODRAFT_480790 [Calocera cornea HHB12733]|uniref:Uncharacterized protein n=1 Tax=Calocera cornea HHB12733 TaxID=1353952 RepID=A0A165I8Q5_9BASI|nr:hypothetical protein CALCODRAFT_480790 [Calocera cornea HHB12733]
MYAISEHDNIQERDRMKTAYFRRYGCRWTELCRLLYFNPTTMGVIDPMHTFMLGLTCTLWFSVWVKGGPGGDRVMLRGRTETKERELDLIHALLRLFEMPRWFARLPAEVGYPTGGNLTSDKWKALVLLYGPTAIPLVLADAAAECSEGLAPGQVPRVPREAAANFLKMATVLKILLRREVTEQDLAQAIMLFKEWFEEFVQIYGSKCVTPTFHWLTHMDAQIRRYGPVHGFWTYLYERLNKVMKTYRTNNHGGGELEVTFSREWKREMMIARLSAALVKQDNDPMGKEVALEIQKQTRDQLRAGTLAEMVQQDGVGDESRAEQRRCVADGRSQTSSLDGSQVPGLLHWYRQHRPAWDLRRPDEYKAPEGSRFLDDHARFHQRLLLQGRRIDTCPQDKPNKSDSLVVMRMRPCLAWAGKLRSVFAHKQCGDTRLFVEVAWLKPLEQDLTIQGMYLPYPELEVEFWQYEEYLAPNADGPPAVLLAQLLDGVAARCAVEVEGHLVWVTTGISLHGKAY